MQILFDVLSVMWQFIWGIICCFGRIIWDNLPQLLELKKIMGYFTPVGMIALYIGVPAIIVSLAIKFIKRRLFG